MDLGVLLSLPVDSVAVQAVLATALCVLLARLVLRAGIRSATVRVIMALTPAVVLLAVVLAAVTHLRLPEIYVPADGFGVLPIRVADGYQHFAPMEIPLLVGLWAVVASLRLTRRAVAAGSARRRAERAIAVGDVQHRVQELSAKVAYRLGVPTPTTTVVDHCAGGAYVIGTRRPVIVLDQTLVDSLDGDELEGVIAHELAHVRRRDNSVAGLLGIVRDLAFFVPGVGWAVRRLHRERELAADQVAAGATGRPGALAAGLLKALEATPGHRSPCAALAPKGTLVDRVRVLVDERPPPGRPRRVCELSAAATVALLSVLLAMVLPAEIAGPDRERDAVALVWSSARDNGPDVADDAEARAFDVYRRSDPAHAEQSTGRVFTDDEQPSVYRRSTLRACAEPQGACPTQDDRIGLGMRPRPVITVDHALTAQWQATPLVSGEGRSEGFRLYWLAVRN